MEENNYVEQIINNIVSLPANCSKECFDTLYSSINFVKDTETKLQLIELLQTKEENNKINKKGKKIQKYGKLSVYPLGLGIILITAASAIKKSSSTFNNGHVVEINRENEKNIEDDTIGEKITNHTVELFKVDVNPEYSNQFFPDDVLVFPQQQIIFGKEFYKKYMTKENLHNLNKEEINDLIKQYKEFNKQCKAGKIYGKEYDLNKDYYINMVRYNTLLAMRAACDVDNKKESRYSDIDYDNYQPEKEQSEYRSLSYNSIFIMSDTCKKFETALDYVSSDENIVCIHTISEEKDQELTDAESFMYGVDAIDVYLQMIDDNDTALAHYINNIVYRSHPEYPPIYDWLEEKGFNNEEVSLFAGINSGNTAIDSASFEERNSETIVKRFDDLRSTLAIKYYKEKGLADYKGLWGDKFESLTGTESEKVLTK